jgi:hypothetical protein
MVKRKEDYMNRIRRRVEKTGDAQILKTSHQLPTPFGSLDLLMLAEVNREVNAPPSPVNRTNGTPDGKGITADH